MQTETSQSPKPYDVKYLVRLALLGAVTVVMAFTPLGYLSIFGAIEISFLCVPVVIGAILLGPIASTVIGFIFGLSSFIMCVSGASPLGAAILSISVTSTFVTTIVTRTLMGFLTGCVYQLLRNLKKPSLSCTATAIASSLMNTVFFSFCVLWLFASNPVLQETYGLTTHVGAFIAGFVGFNGLVEIIVCGLLGFAIARIVIAVDNRKNKKAAAQQPAATNTTPPPADGIADDR